MTDADYADNLTFPLNTPAQAEALLNNLEHAAGGIGFSVKDKMETIWINYKRTKRKLFELITLQLLIIAM